MPILDGVEACKRLRIMEGKRKVPIVLPSTFPITSFSHCD